MRTTWLLGNFLIAVLTGCSSSGGGGGGGGGGEPLSGTFALNSQAVSFNRDLLGGSGDAQVVTGSLTNPSGNVYLFVELNQSGLISQADVFIDQNAGTGALHLWPRATGDVGPGTHTEQIRVRACGDANCTRQYTGSPKTIDVTYTVTAPPFEISSTEVVFTTFAGASELPAPQVVNVASDIHVGAWSNTTFPADHWLHVDYNWEGETGTAVFSVNKPMPAGEYQVPVTLGLGGMAYHHVVNVTWKVLDNPIQLSNGSVHFLLNPASTSADLQRGFTVENAGDVDEFGWNASVNVPWLTLSRNSGDTQAELQVVVHVNNAVANLSPGDHQATVTIADEAGTLGDNRIAVTLTLDLPVVQGVFPYIAYPEQAQEVVVAGEGFTPASVIMVGTRQINAVEYISPERLKITVPALSTGTHPVYVQSPLGASISESRIVVVEHAAFDATEFDFEAQFQFIYDEQRKAVYSYHAYTQHRPGEVIAKRYRDGAWSERSLTALKGSPIETLTMTPDGRHLVALGSGQMDVINLDAFQVTASYTAPIHSFNPRSLAFYKNRKAMIAVDEVRNLDLAGKFTQITALEGHQQNYSEVVALPFQHRMALLRLNVSYPTIGFHNLITGETPTAVDVQCTVFNRDGDKCLSFNDVYQVSGDTFELLGTLPYQAAFTPEGTDAVVYDVAKSEIKKYDLLQSDGTEFAETGTSVPFVSDQPYGAVNSVTEDGRFVFIRLENRLAIVPLGIAL